MDNPYAVLIAVGFAVWALAMVYIAAPEPPHGHRRNRR
jgi:nitrate reductase NapE component